jgi:hypothetical protein
MEAPKKKARKVLAHIASLEIVARSNVVIAPTNGHKYKDLVCVRGNNFAPSIAETATLT